MPLARDASVSGDATRLQIIRRGSGPAGESRASMAKKAAPKVTNAKATATPKAAPSAADTSAAARPRPASKTAVYTRLAETTGLRRRDITAVFAALGELIGRELGKRGRDGSSSPAS